MAVCINLRNQNHCHSDSKHASRQVTSAHFANHQHDMTLSKFQVLIFNNILGTWLLYIMHENDIELWRHMQFVSKVGVIPAMIKRIAFFH